MSARVRCCCRCEFSAGINIGLVYFTYSLTYKFSVSLLRNLVCFLDLRDPFLSVTNCLLLPNFTIEMADVCNNC